MSNSKKLIVIAAAALSACTLLEPVPKIDLANSYSIIDGDTVKTRVEKDFKEYKKNDPNARNFIIVGDTVLTYKAPKLHTPPAKAPDLSKLKNNDDPDLKGKPLRMVAIGGSLTAGVRDGGYFNEGILTSYPNLIARQMGIKFEQPLFDADSYNGYGRKVRTSFNPTGGPVQKFKEVSNNSGVESTTDVEGEGIKRTKLINLKKAKNVSTLDNYAFPNFKKGHLTLNLQIDEMDFNSHSKMNKSFASRLTNNDQKTYVETSLERKRDLLIYEMGWENIILEIKNLGINENQPSYWDSKVYIDAPLSYLKGMLSVDQNLTFTRLLLDEKLKSGVFLNVPNIHKFPAFSSIKNIEIDKVAKIANTPFLYIGGGMVDVFNVNSLSPTSEVDSMLSPKVNILLKKGLSSGNPLGVISAGYNQERVNSLINRYNNDLNYFAKKLNFPVVDINSLYERILKGGYVTDDGVRIDPSYPNGNFFSSDGIYPTALGQAVIANEVIKTLNAYYKTQISLIKTAEYLVK